MAEPRASGPAALFALWVVFEAAVTSVHALVIRRPALCTRRLGLKGWFEFGGAFSCVDAAFSRRFALSQGWRRAMPDAY